MQGPNRQAGPAGFDQEGKDWAIGESLARVYLVQVPRPGTQIRPAGVSPGTSWRLAHAA